MSSPRNSSVQESGGAGRMTQVVADATAEYLEAGPVKIIVTIEYDRYLGRPHFCQLRKALYASLLPDTRYPLLVTGLAGRYRSFEIRVQHKLVYSRLETGYFPSVRGIVGLVSAALLGEPFLTCGAPESAFAKIRFH